jgi:hypothetical protein
MQFYKVGDKVNWLGQMLSIIVAVAVTNIVAIFIYFIMWAVYR